jgi:hypothetical protein
VTRVNLAAEKASIVLEKILAFGIGKLRPGSRWLRVAAGGSGGTIGPEIGRGTAAGGVGIGSRAAGTRDRRGRSASEFLAVIEIPGHQSGASNEDFQGFIAGQSRKDSKADRPGQASQVMTGGPSKAQTTSNWSKLQNVHLEFSRILDDGTRPLFDGFDDFNDIGVVMRALKLLPECCKELVEGRTGVHPLISVDKPGFGLATEEGAGKTRLVARRDLGKVHVFFDLVGPRVNSVEGRIGAVKLSGPRGLGERDVAGRFGGNRRRHARE